MTSKLTKKQLEERLFQSDVALHKSRQQLSESQLAFSPPYELINPFSLFYDGQSLLFPVYPSRLDYRTSSSYIFLSETQLDLLRSYARFLYETNTWAKGVVERLCEFIIKGGYTFEVQPARDRDTDKTLVKKAQKMLDDFGCKNQWNEIRQQELFRRSLRDGEWFLQFFPQEDAITSVRVVEPECIRSPNSEPDWTFGCKSDGDDRETILDYNITYRGMADQNITPADEVLHSKINVDLGVKRGLSDFFASQETLQNSDKLRRCMQMGESVRQSFAYIREHQQASADTITSIQAAATTYQEPYPSTTGFSNLVNVQQLQPGSVHDIPAAMKFINPPSVMADNAVKVLQESLQSLAQYWNVPAWLLTGDSSSSSYASSLVEESPFSRMCETEQGFYSHEFKAVMVKVLEIAIQQGELPDDALERLDVQVITPSITTRQADKQTARNQMLHSSGVMSKRTWTHLEDLDYDHEKENFQRDEPDFVPSDNLPQTDQQKDDSKPRETDVSRGR